MARCENQSKFKINQNLVRRGFGPCTSRTLVGGLDVNVRSAFADAMFVFVPNDATLAQAADRFDHDVWVSSRARLSKNEVQRRL